MATETAQNLGALADLALDLNPDQSGADSWSQSPTLQSGSDAPPAATDHDLTIGRERCTELVHGGMTSGAEVRRTLQEELGRTFAHATVQRWVRSDRASAPRPDIGAVADRALALASSELERLERHRGQTDLDRLQRIAQILKSLQGMTTSTKRGSDGRRTLQDLSGG